MFFGTIAIASQGFTGFPGAGTVLSSSCGYYSDYDAAGYLYSGYFEKFNQVADGVGGSYTVSVGVGTSPCYYPAGWRFSNGPYSDLNAYWSHGNDLGMVYYGSYDGSSIADGNGGQYTPGNSYTNTGGGYVVHDYVGVDPTTSQPAHFTLWWGGQAYNFGFYEIVYPAAGNFQYSTCSDYNQIDARGVSYTLHKRIDYFADGWGGSISYETSNTSDCGYDPQGFAYSYGASSESFQYYGDGGFQYTYYYHTFEQGYVADGFGNSNLESFNDWHANMGDVIQTYYDPYLNQTVTLYYDGNTGYYAYYS